MPPDPSLRKHHGNWRLGFSAARIYALRAEPEPPVTMMLSHFSGGNPVMYVVFLYLLSLYAIISGKIVCISELSGIGSTSEETYIDVHRLLVAHINPLQMTLPVGSQATFTCRATYFTNITDVCISFMYNSDVHERCNTGDYSISTVFISICNIIA